MDAIYTIVLTKKTEDFFHVPTQSFEYKLLGNIFRSPVSDENCGNRKTLHILQGMPYVSELIPNFNQTIRAKIRRRDDGSFDITEIVSVEPLP